MQAMGRLNRGIRLSAFSTEWSLHTDGNRAPSAKFLNMHLMNRCLIGVYLTGVHLMA
jgi:hypothetical protein